MAGGAARRGDRTGPLRRGAWRVTEPTPTAGSSEDFFRESEYWRSWSGVPDLTADIPYAIGALRAAHRWVLDAPCGRGRILRGLAARRPGLRLVGIDVNHRMVRQVKESVPDALALVASVYALPFRDRAFDLVLCHQSFMHFDQPADALGELTRVTRSDLYISVTTRRQLNTLLRRLGFLRTDAVPHWTYNLEDLTRLLPTHEFVWRIVGAFLLGHKALRLPHAQHVYVHRVIGRWLPQWLLRRVGQTLFAYGRRRSAGPS